MESAWSRVLDRLSRHGSAWVWRRVRFEWLTPTTRPGRTWLMVRLHLRAAWTAITRPWRVGGPATDDRTLYAFYDLEVAPITFDVLWFIALAEQRRRALELNHVAFLVVPGKNNGLRMEDPVYEVIVDAAARRRRIDGMLLPLLSMLPSSVSVRLAGSRDEATALCRRASHVCPTLYDTRLPVMHESRDVIAAAKDGGAAHCLRAPGSARERIAVWHRRNVGDRRLVTITLRQYEYLPLRNSDIASWTRFMRGLDPIRYAVCVVPDAARSGGPRPDDLDEFMYMPEASWDAELRLALYDSAFANLGSSSGPLNLCFFSEKRPPCLMFRILDERVPQASERFLRHLGFVPGQDPPVLGPRQHWVWEPDSHAVIVRKFQSLVEEIEAARA